MAFIDMDPLEEDMGLRCEDMSADQLVAYIKGYHEAFGLNLKIEGRPERATLVGLQRVYGKEDAGRIVKWSFYEHKGRWGNQPVIPFSFAKGRKWWTDKMHLEMQAEMNRSSSVTYTATTLGVRSLADL